MHAHKDNRGHASFRGDSTRKARREADKVAKLARAPKAIAAAQAKRNRKAARRLANGF